MKTLALLGGMSHGATSIYYNLINREIQRRLGGANSATLLLQSFNHHEMQNLFTNHQWDQVTHRFTTAARNLKAAGAQGVLICCNIGHKVAEQVEAQSGLPLLHIADPTGRRIREAGIAKVALIGTRAVMEDTFFRDRLKTKFGIEVVVPDETYRGKIQDMIFRELGANVFHDGQKEVLRGAIEQTVKEWGAKGVVFACTELQFVLKQEDVSVPLWDTMEGHAEEAVRWMLEGEDAR